MMAFLERGRSRPKGAHVHTPEGFGLRAEAIRERFKAYCETFDL